MENSGFIKLKGHERPLTNIVCDIQNKVIYSSAKDQNIVFWNKNDNKYSNTIVKGTGATWVVGYTKDNIYTGSADGTMRLLDRKGNNICSYNGSGPIRSINYDEEKMIFIVLSKILSQNKSRLNILDKNLNELSFLDLSNECNCCTFLNNKIITGGKDGTLGIYNLEGCVINLLNLIQSHKSEISKIDFDLRKNILVSSSYDKNLNIYDLNTFEIKSKYLHCVSILCFSIHPNENVIVLGGGQDKMSVASSKEDGEFNIICINSLNSEKLFQFDSKHFGPINTIAFNLNSYGIISGGEDGYIHIWNYEKNWIQENKSKFIQKELDDMRRILIESQKLYNSLLGAGKKSKNQRRNLSKKIEKLQMKLSSSEVITEVKEEKLI